MQSGAIGQLALGQYEIEQAEEITIEAVSIKDGGGVVIQIIDKPVLF